ncbi:GerAB/ArcD/ProY family transporter [Peribacillus frigoritolerans]|nr:GerAB/ArcD/ProY family transporter [Peribacillus frigoritolerans]
MPITGQILRSYGEYIVDSFLVKTPISVIMASMILLCAFIICGGIEVLGRAAQLFVPVFIIPILLLIILLGPDLEFKNIFRYWGMELCLQSRVQLYRVDGSASFFSDHFYSTFFNGYEKGMKHGMMTVFAVMMTLVVVNLIVLFCTRINDIHQELSPDECISVHQFCRLFLNIWSPPSWPYG